MVVVSQPFDIPAYSAISDCGIWIIASKLGVTDWTLVYPASTNAVQFSLAMHYGCMFLWYCYSKVRCNWVLYLTFFLSQGGWRCFIQRLRHAADRGPVWQKGSPTLAPWNVVFRGCFCRWTWSGYADTRSHTTRALCFLNSKHLYLHWNVSLYQYYAYIKCVLSSSFRL